ncbi:MAG TPA: ABC transporter substrate-binding protein [Longimicrobiaceae bacterium]|nr:ABC transporter substrate-binding protein [Longimicrobiaceae bacterium]
MESMTSAVRARTRWRRTAAAAALGVVVTALAGCGAERAAAGPVTLDFYAPLDVSGAYQQVADDCGTRSDGRYRVVYHKLPAAADAQRRQMVRRLAAHDESMDILGLDITWPAEFAEAGWIRPWPAELAAEVRRGTLPSALATGTWRGRLVAAPLVTNVQLLWYRADLVPHPPRTWDEMIEMAEALAREGKPHYVEVQGAQYEGAVVWFNTLVASAGGSILTDDSGAPALGAPALTALRTVKRLATSPAADPSLSNEMEDQTRLAMERGEAAFELNWPYVWPSMQTNKPTVNGVELWKVFKWAPYPAVDPGLPSRVTTGGLSLAVSAYTRHPALAFDAALCMRDHHSQHITAVRGGFSPTLEDFYLHPDEEFATRFPFYRTIYEQLKNATNRPKTPAYQSVSIVISHSVSPPDGIEPEHTLKRMTARIEDALASRGLIP